MKPVVSIPGNALTEKQPDLKESTPQLRWQFAPVINCLDNRHLLNA